MKTYNSPGRSLKLTAPAGGVVSGTPYQIGKLFGVAAATVAATLKFELLVQGVVDIPKVAAEPWSEGLTVYWNTGSAKGTSVSTTALTVGIAVEARTNPSSTGRVLLIPGGVQN